MITIKEYLAGSATLASMMADDKIVHANIKLASIILNDALDKNKKVLACGNGGSMSDAMHFCSELTGRYRETRDPIAALALSDPGAMSCIANDFGYEHVFRRQVSALGNRGDVLLAISTSGTSKNVIMAIHQAKENGMKVISLTGIHGMKDSGYSDVEIRVPHNLTNFIQEQHIKIIHILVELIEQHQ